MQYEIKLDIDNKYIMPKSTAQRISKRIKYVSNIINLKVNDIEVYETKRGYHIYIKVETPAKFDARDITFIQLLLQSDWRREVYNWLRARADLQLPSWNVLFQIKFSNNGISFEGKTERSEKLKYYLTKYLKGDNNEQKETVSSEESSMENV